MQLLPLAVALITIAVAWGKLSTRIDTVEAAATATQLRLEQALAAEQARREQLARELEAIRISLVRIEATLAGMQRAA